MRKKSLNKSRYLDSNFGGKFKLNLHYRVPGVEHKVAKICAAFESAPDLVELTDVQHHTLANVLKRYLGQLPEPLVTVVLYQVIFTTFVYKMTLEPSYLSILKVTFVDM